MSELNSTDEVPSIAELLVDPTASAWLKLALRFSIVPGSWRPLHNKPHAPTAS